MKASQVGIGTLPFRSEAGQGVVLDLNFKYLGTCAVCGKEKVNCYGRHTHHKSGISEITCSRECEQVYEEKDYSRRIIEIE